MPQYIAAHPRRTSDENWALRIASITLIAVLCMFALGYFLSTYLIEGKQELRAQQQQYQDYRRATTPSLTSTTTASNSAALPADMVQAQQVRARLLAHPAVTPGPGFDRPGVQSTAITIVDTIDETQRR